MPGVKKTVLLELQEVDLSFGDLEILKNYNLKLNEGDSLVLVGPSGSGKSSLLKLMAGLLSPQKGRVLYRGRDISTLSKKDREQQMSEMGMLFQQNALFDSKTVYDNLKFVVEEVGGRPLTRIQQKEITDLLAAVGLDHVLNNYPSQLSGGMQKRLGIARALVLKPKFVFYDDPTAGLDPITSRNIVKMILQLKKEWGGTIVTATNDMKRAFQLAGECLICFPGEFVATGDAENTKKHPDPRVQQFINGLTQGPLEAL